jgi:hypothetical protein
MLASSFAIQSEVADPHKPQKDPDELLIIPVPKPSYYRPELAVREVPGPTQTCNKSRFSIQGSERDRTGLGPMRQPEGAFPGVLRGVVEAAAVAKRASTLEIKKSRNY